MNDSKKNPDVLDAALDKRLLRAMARGDIEKICRQYHISLEVAMKRMSLLPKRPEEYRLDVYLRVNK